MIIPILSKKPQTPSYLLSNSIHFAVFSFRTKKMVTQNKQKNPTKTKR